VSVIQVELFPGQNWLITPAALAVNELEPSNIGGQPWLLVLSGIGIVNFNEESAQVDPADDWTRGTVRIQPDIDSALEYAVHRYSIPVPKTRIKTDGVPVFDADQWVPFAAVSSWLTDRARVPAFAVEYWKPTHFESIFDVAGNPLHHVFSGIDVTLAVREAIIYRVSYHITLVGKIVFREPME
jgi:hypothetical protein